MLWWLDWYRGAALKGNTDDLQTLSASSASLLALVNDILDLSRIEAGKDLRHTSVFRLDDVITSIHAIFKVEAENKGLKLAINNELPGCTCLEGDKQLVIQVLSNLLGNAIKFTESGTIKLNVEGYEKSAEQVHLVFTVQDTGKGIPEEQQEKIFNSFTQANNSHTRTHGGAGLGLTISRQLAESIGGSLKLKSEPGIGSTFTFTADYQRAEICKLDKSAMPDAEIVSDALSGLNILLVEDDAINQQIATGLLHASGASVTIAGSGPEALKQLAMAKPSVILMDIQMPGMDGYETTREIRSISNLDGIPIIAMTAHAFNDAREKAASMEMDDFITKPINPRHLVNTILKWANPGIAADQAKHLSSARDAGQPVDSAEETRQSLKEVTNSLNQPAAHQLLSASARSLPRRIEELNTSIKNQAWEKAAKQAHQIKGMMFIFGNTHIKELLRAIEKHQENSIDPDAVISELQTEMEQVMQQINSTLNDIEMQYKTRADQTDTSDYWQHNSRSVPRNRVAEYQG